LLLEAVVAALARGELEPPAVVVDDDVDAVRVVERRRASVVRRDNVSSETKRVVPYPRRYGTITR
jgi:hypothetical protein